mmetsp:Transcript_2769/g.3248  ORF Transcript_2769/g.3248 Transcript_2769/m.3248 type:complete len:407 (+) Transcript_2769:80-1300(+)
MLSRFKTSLGLSHSLRWTNRGTFKLSRQSLVRQLRERCLSSASNAGNRAPRQSFSVLENRGLIKVTGSDSTEYLQGLITNDIYQLSSAENATKSMFAAFLSPKGRMISEAIFYQPKTDEYLIDCSNDCIKDIGKLLQMYKLRKDVQVSLASPDFDIYQVMDGLCYAENSESSEALKAVYEQLDVADDSIVSFDPRHSGLGLRIITSAHNSGIKERLSSCKFIETEGDTYEKWRMLNGIPEGKECEGSIPLEMNLEKLGGVSFRKGCYTGQELTARTHHKGLVRKRLLPIRLSSSQHVEGNEVCPDSLFPEWMDAISDATVSPDSLNEKFGETKVEYINPPPNAKKSSPARIVSACFSDSGSGFGLALIRLDSEGAVPGAYLQPGSLVAQGINIWVPKIPLWWTEQT